MRRYSLINLHVLMIWTQGHLAVVAYGASLAHRYCPYGLSGVFLNCNVSEDF